MADDFIQAALGKVRVPDALKGGVAGADLVVRIRGAFVELNFLTQNPAPDEPDPDVVGVVTARVVMNRDAFLTFSTDITKAVAD